MSDKIDTWPALLPGQVRWLGEWRGDLRQPVARGSRVTQLAKAGTLAEKEGPMPRTLSSHFTPTKPEEIAAVLAGLATITPGGTMYLSTPLTTGLRYHQFLRTGLDRERHAGAYRADVLYPNRQAARATAARLRRDLQWAVICPIDLDRESWTDADCMVLWLTVIRTQAWGVAANEGWYLSSGCVMEVAEAYLRWIPVYDHLFAGPPDAKAMSPSTALSLVSEGRAALAELGLDTKWHDIAYTAIAEVILSRSERA